MSNSGLVVSLVKYAHQMVDFYQKTVSFSEEPGMSD